MSAAALKIHDLADEVSAGGRAPALPTTRAGWIALLLDAGFVMRAPKPKAVAKYIYGAELRGLLGYADKPDTAWHHAFWKWKILNGISTVKGRYAYDRAQCLAVLARNL
jgi:hypothetical protein